MQSGIRPTPRLKARRSWSNHNPSVTPSLCATHVKELRKTRTSITAPGFRHLPSAPSLPFFRGHLLPPLTYLSEATRTFQLGPAVARSTSLPYQDLLGSSFIDRASEPQSREPSSKEPASADQPHPPTDPTVTTVPFREGTGNRPRASGSSDR